MKIGDNNNENEKTAQTKDENNNFLAAGLTVMLGFFSGSVSNFNVDIIREFGSFLGLFEQKEEEIKKLKTILFNEGSSS